MQSLAGNTGSGSSMVKLPGDVAPARIYFYLRTTSLTKAILFRNFSRF